MTDDESGESMEPVGEVREVPLYLGALTTACKRVLDLLEPCDLRFGQVVIKRVAVVNVSLSKLLHSHLLRFIAPQTVRLNFMRRFASF